MSSETIFIMHITVLGFFAATSVVLVLTAALGIDTDSKEAKKEFLPIQIPSAAPFQKMTLANAHESQSHILFAGFTALFLSLFSCILLISADTHQVLVWRVVNGISALIHIRGTYMLIFETLKLNLHSFKRWILSIIGGSIGMLSLFAALGALPSLSSALAMIAILWMLAVASISFYSLIELRQASNALAK